MFTKETGMVGIIIGRWMFGIDWNSGISLFVFDMNTDDDVWSKRMI